MKLKSATLALSALMAGLLWAVSHSCAYAGPALTPDKARAIVAPVYDALTEPGKKDVDALLKQTTTDDFTSCTTDSECVGRDALIARFKGLADTVPDLSWTIKDLWVSGSDVIVRGEAIGTPVRVFLGVQPTGKSFKTMSIDIYQTKNGRVVRSYHVENWTSAIRQLTAK